MKNIVLNHHRLHELLEKTTEKDIGMFVAAVGMAYNNNQINFPSMKCLLNAMMDKFNTNL